MTISIVIPAHNEEEVLPDLLRSIVAQTIQPFEVIVVDSNCTDDTVARAHEFDGMLPLTIHTATEKGVVPARNQGADQATGDFLLFLDADAVLPKRFLESFTLEVHDRQLKAGGFRQTMPSKQWGIRFGARMMNVYARTMAHTPWPICFSCFFAARAVHRQIGGFDPEIYIMEDYDYALRARRSGAKFGIIRSTFFYASARRFEAQDGGASALRGAYGELYRYTHGLRVTKPIYDYTFGGDIKNKKSR